MKIAFVLAAIVVALAVPVLQPGGGMAIACPPGLAKKDPPCVPPGQARNGDGLGTHTHRGGIADRDNLYFLDDYSRYSLPALPAGQRYAVVDDQIVTIDADTYEILQLIRLFTALSN